MLLRPESWCWGITIFQFKSALCNDWGTLETFHRACYPIADFRSSIQSGLWKLVFWKYLSRWMTSVLLIHHKCWHFRDFQLFLFSKVGYLFSLTFPLFQTSIKYISSYIITWYQKFRPWFSSSYLCEDYSRAFQVFSSFPLVLIEIMPRARG